MTVLPEDYLEEDTDEIEMRELKMDKWKWLEINWNSPIDYFVHCPPN